jgi:hypothetical protein
VFYQLYKREVDAQIAKRWQALWDAAARGAIEAGERGGDQPQADSAGAQGVEGGRGVVWDHAAFHKAKVVGEVRLRQVYQPPYSPESCEAGICGGSVVGRRA